MIDKKKIDIFLKYKGFYEGFQRSSKNKNGLSDAEWFLIDELITDSSLMMKKLSSKEFNESLEKKLIANCDNSETIGYLKKSSLKDLY